ncbi:MAG TPA: prepilin-type cleavage/methylation domain-containing protein [Rhodanobacteraceae bacterium]|nr:prepilin-type cleavage/methylation domain-containing protein [Rhodanobacteraceae bacterium]
MIAAFLIFALGFGILLQILTSSLHVAQRSKDYSEASLWAQSKLDTVGVGEAIEESSTSGRFDQDYRWRMQITPWQPPAEQAAPQQGGLPIDLYRVALTVYWGPDGKHHADFVTLRAVNANQNDIQGRLNLGGPEPSQ